jgi:hypothetical protein
VSPEMLGSSGMGSFLVFSCNIWSFVIEMDYGYRYLLEVYSELSDICFMIWLRYHSMLALHDRTMLAIVTGLTQSSKKNLDFSTHRNYIP